MRRLPVYFVLDVSESMIGEPIQQVQDGMRMIINDLRNDPYALETVFVSIIGFAGKAHVISPLEELYKFYPPQLPIGDGTSLGDALNCLMSDMDKSIQKTTMEAKGDWKPIIFLFTDGVPTDDPTKAIEKWNRKYRRQCNLIAISLGEGVDTFVLGQMTDDVLRLKDTDRDSFKKFFKWVTASIKTSSMSVSDYSDDEVKLAPIDNIDLEKIDPHKHVNVDENYVVLHNKCASTGKSYLVKYGSVALLQKTVAPDVLQNVDRSSYVLIGAYPFDIKNYEKFSDSNSDRELIASDKLLGSPTCPHCGNEYQYWCECGKVSCCAESGSHTCPWCGDVAEEIGTLVDPVNTSRERG